MAAIFCCLTTAVRTAAQEEDETLVEGVPLENAVVGRALAVRLRAEMQFTEDDDDIIDQNINYKRFPAKMYAGEIKLFQKDRFTFGVADEVWKNAQDLSVDRWGWNTRVPLGKIWRMTLKYKRWDEQDGPDKNYHYAGLSRFVGKKIYSYTQYRHTTEGGDEIGHQLSQYISWNPEKRLRMGGQGAFSRESDSSGMKPWYARLFTTIFLIEDLTSLRLEAQHYESAADLTYEEYTSYLYQKLGSQSLLRLDCRYYHDNSDLTSYAWGIKAKRYFSPRVSAHIGYRWYDHSEGTDFDTVFAGASVLL